MNNRHEENQTSKASKRSVEDLSLVFCKKLRAEAYSGISIPMQARSKGRAFAWWLTSDKIGPGVGSCRNCGISHTFIFTLAELLRSNCNIRMLHEGSIQLITTFQTFAEYHTVYFMTAMFLMVSSK